MRVDLGDWLGRHVFMTGEYEPATSRLIRTLLRKGDTFVDIGANIGYFTLLAAKSVGSRGSVFSFEPLPDVRARLVENIQINGLTNCTVREEAAFNTAAQHEFFAGPCDHLGTSSLRKLSDASEVISVRTLRVDEAIPKELQVSVVKIDVEGAEYQAIEGLQGVIDRSHPDLIVEVTPEYLQRMGASAQQLYDRLSAMKYRAFVVKDQGVVPVGADGVDGLVQANVLFSRRRELPAKLLVDV